MAPAPGSGSIMAAVETSGSVEKDGKRKNGGTRLLQNHNPVMRNNVLCD